MKYTLALVALLALLNKGTAECPNMCSGHGLCTNYKPVFSTGALEQYSMRPTGFHAMGYDVNTAKKDSCTCFNEKGKKADGTVVDVAQWTGADCSLRVCPHGTAFGVHKRTDLVFTISGNDHSAMLECSGVGTCDTATGQCICEKGYTGDACQRTTCPNDCSGNGVCKSLAQIVNDVKDNAASYPNSVDFSALAYNGKDAEKSRACVCDSLYYGADCSIKRCPSDSDPMGGSGAAEGLPCSGRGNCKNGECVCFTGFFGTSCQEMRANVM